MFNVNVAYVTTAGYTCIIYTSKASLNSDPNKRHYWSVDLDSQTLSLQDYNFMTDDVKHQNSNCKRLRVECSTEFSHDNF
jgi:hypothetical protein